MFHYLRWSRTFKPASAKKTRLRKAARWYRCRFMISTYSYMIREHNDANSDPEIYNNANPDDEFLLFLIIKTSCHRLENFQSRG